MAPNDIQRFFPASQFGQISEMVSVTMGQSEATVYSVTTENGAYILRIDNHDKVSWQNIILAHEFAANNEIAPKILHIDRAEQVTVSVRVSGTSFGAAISQPATRTAALQSLIEILRKLHALPAPTIAALDPIHFARSIWAEQAQRKCFPSWATPLQNRIAAADELLKHDQRKVFSHCDLHPANSLWDGERVWLVDWERAGLAHPYIDLATICNFLSLPDDIALNLLEQQEQQPIDEAQRRVFAAIRDLCRVAYGAVFFRRVPDSMPFASRADTPTLRECFAMLTTGKLQLGEPQGASLIGAAFLKQCEG